MRTLPRRAAAAMAAAALAGLAACSTPPTPATPAQVTGGTEGRADTTTVGADWPTYHGDTARTGYLAKGPDPASPAVAWKAKLDGQVYASPLVVKGTVLAGTENGTLYALDAVTGTERWHTHLADPVRASSLPCGNIKPTVGITGTPVYDPASGQVFAAATTTGPKHVLFGVDLASGRIVSRRAADAPGSDPSTHLQRGALLLTGGTVYVPYGGNWGDCGQYQGRVVGLPTTGDGALQAYSVPTPREGGIWAPPGPSALPGGDLLVTTGNGEATSGTWDSSDSILRLSPQLRQKDGFAPTGWAQENSDDADLGSTGPALLPGGKRVLAAGKGGEIYLADVDKLGGVGGQLAKLDKCESYGGTAVTPGASGGAVAFIPCDDGVLQVVVGADDTLKRGWQDGDVSGSPIVVGTTVWAVQGPTLHGLDAATGRQRASVTVGDASHFATPAASGKALFVPTNSGVTAVTIAP